MSAIPSRHDTFAGAPADSDRECESAPSSGAWYRSATPPPRIAPTPQRRVRDWLRALLPEPQVRGRTIVLHSRRTLPKLSRRGFGSEYHGLFSEFHSVLGALIWARDHGAAAVRVDFESSLYADRVRGPNWWTYFFDGELIPLTADVHRPGHELHLNRILTKYGRYGGFSDVVQGATPYFYPMTWGIDRQALHRLVDTQVRLRPEICDEATSLAHTLFDPQALIIGVHYRGTDSTHGLTGALTHYRTGRVPYRVYCNEIRRVMSANRASRYQVFVATDEASFLQFVRGEFPGCVVALDVPRAKAGGGPVHLDRSHDASGYDKGKSAIVDSLLLASTDYLIKGRSNLSDASLVFNPELPYSFRPDVAIPSSSLRYSASSA